MSKKLKRKVFLRRQVEKVVVNESEGLCWEDTGFSPISTTTPTTTRQRTLESTLSHDQQEHLYYELEDLFESTFFTTQAR